MAEPTQPTSSPRCAVVTVSYGSEDVLGPFLASVPAASASPLAVVIADNLPSEAGTTGTVPELAQQHGARYLPMP